MKKIGIVLLNMGSPGSVDEVRPFLYRLFMDIDIFSFPGGKWLRRPFATLISTVRAPRVKERYQQLGGKSPLLAYTQQQASGLERVLTERGVDVSIEVGMRYSQPFTSEAVQNLVARGAQVIIGLPLYPQYSTSTTGSSLQALKSAVEQMPSELSYFEISSWCHDPGYHAALAKRIQDAMAKVKSKNENVGILFLAHSIPVRFVEKGDPYVDHVKVTVKGVLNVLRNQGGDEVPWFLGYQSRVGPVKWVGPTVLESLNHMLAKGIRQVVVAPVSFVSDHLETLYEIDLQYKPLALELGFQCFERMASLNAGQDFIDVLANQVLQKLGSGPGALT